MRGPNCVRQGRSGGALRIQGKNRYDERSAGGQLKRFVEHDVLAVVVGLPGYPARDAGIKRQSAGGSRNRVQCQLNALMPLRFVRKTSFCCMAVFLQFWYTDCMTKVITVSGRGALTLPKEAREKLGVTRGGQLVLDMDEKGEVILRAGVVLPVEIYSAARVEEFQQMNESPLSGRKLRWRKVR